MARYSPDGRSKRLFDSKSILLFHGWSKVAQLTSWNACKSFPLMPSWDPLSLFFRSISGVISSLGAGNHSFDVWGRFHSHIVLMSHQSASLEAGCLWMRSRKLLLFLVVPVLGWGPQTVSFVAQICFMKICIFLTDECFGIIDRRAIRFWVCSIKTEPAIVDIVHWDLWQKVRCQCRHSRQIFGWIKPFSNPVWILTML